MQPVRAPYVIIVVGVLLDHNHDGDDTDLCHFGYIHFCLPDRTATA